MLVSVIDDGPNGKDFLKFNSIYNHPQVNPYILVNLKKEESFYPYYKKFCKEDDVLYYTNDKGEIIGQCRIVKKETARSHVVEICSLAIDPKFQGLGYSKEMIEAIKNYVIKNQGTKFDYSDVIRIELSYEADNPSAMPGM